MFVHATSVPATNMTKHTPRRNFLQCCSIEAPYLPTLQDLVHKAVTNYQSLMQLLGSPHQQIKLYTQNLPEGGPCHPRPITSRLPPSLQK
jgi:hypothetical protein